MKYLAIAALIPVLTAACSGTGAQHEPVLSVMPGPAYTQDLADCRALAKSQELWNPETRSQTVIGATVGALAGLGDDSVSNGNGALAGAIVGAGVGAAKGATDMRHTRRAVLVQCLRERGHSVAG